MGYTVAERQNTIGLNNLELLYSVTTEILCHGHDSRELFVMAYRVTERYNTICWNNLEQTLLRLKNNNSNHVHT